MLYAIHIRQELHKSKLQCVVGKHDSGQVSVNCSTHNKDRFRRVLAQRAHDRTQLVVADGAVTVAVEEREGVAELQDLIVRQAGLLPYLSPSAST
jgi:hypothetical protein